ncbi:hypothetical protein RJT34_30854 [Clitoria ternatea]|uniref:VQ domain-containing protein n=1 Tax=Clitoria ternatea TaxID=43366 RepID=A0AAN9ET82_CLITE
MEAYSSSYSSSNSSYLTQNTEESKGLKHVYPFQSHNSLLHSVRKTPAKPWKKAPVAPMPPTPVKVYKVDPMNFRDLVQQLTGGAVQNQQPRQQVLQSNTARVSSATSSFPKQKESKWYGDIKSEAFEFGRELREGNNDGALMTVTPDFLDMNLSSPSSFSSWCSFPPISPRTVTSS